MTTMNSRLIVSPNYSVIKGAVSNMDIRLEFGLEKCRRNATL
jgi:hypothetical protein